MSKSLKFLLFYFHCPKPEVEWGSLENYFVTLYELFRFIIPSDEFSQNKSVCKIIGEKQTKDATANLHTAGAGGGGLVSVIICRTFRYDRGTP